MSFENYPPLDFTITQERQNLINALKKLENDINDGELIAKPIINGERIDSKNVIDSIDPSDGETVVGKVYLASVEDTENAIEALKAYEREWILSSPESRIQALKNTAEALSEQRFELCSLIIREAGKPWKEADADVAEAIDFCNYYAFLAEQLFLNPRKTQDVLGEQNQIKYLGKGLTTVIAPWNFPLAILTGMTVAGLVTGNVVAIKPAEQTSLIASKLVSILLASGFPQESLAFLPGIGEEVGAKLVKSIYTKQICFTGSMAVGKEILSVAKEIPEGQTHIKGVISELGGKNAIIVDDDADLDEALKGILYSAFAFSGQKCSALSRLIVVDSAYEPLLERLKESARDIISGPADESSSFLGPVIDEEARDRLLKAISRYKQEIPLLCESDIPNTGYFVPITIFKDVPTDSEIWNTELFGPVLAVTKAKDFDHAIDIANNSPYALTAGLFSRSPSNIEKATSLIEAGNIYINRSCTGAIVERHPFGGYKLSGTGNKAGGVDYLKQFVVVRCISENTMRRGFTPELV